VIGVLLLVPAPTKEAAAQSGDAASRCIRVQVEARYRALGYDHLVHLANICAAPATCIVATDVNPEPQRVEVPGRSQADVVTFIGSPARVFVPRVACQMTR